VLVVVVLLSVEDNTNGEENAHDVEDRCAAAGTDVAAAVVLHEVIEAAHCASLAKLPW